MRLPANTAAVRILIELGWFAVCAIEADDETDGLQGEMATADKALRASLGVRNRADDERVRARARNSVAKQRFAAWLRQLGLDAKAAFGGKTQAPGYVRLLPLAPSKLMSQDAVTRRKTIGKVIDALAQADTPPALAASAERGKQLLAAWDATEALVTQAQEAFATAVQGVRAERNAWLLAYKRLHASLEHRFVADPDRVESYFDQPPVATKADEVEPVPA